MNETLEIEVKGRRVAGRFTHRSPVGLEVEILSPIGVFHLSMHMPFYSKRKLPRGLLDDMISGKKLLSDLDTLCSYLENHRDQILRRYRSMSVAMRELERASPLSDEAYDSIRRQLEESAMLGDITHDEYRCRMLCLSEEYSKRHHYRWQLRKNFFKSFPFPVEPELQEQVLRYLRKESWSTATV